MERKCYNCGRALDNEPAIRGLNGLTCFPCRYNFDKSGGERFLIDYQSYLEKQRDWELNHKDKWVKYQRQKRIKEVSLYLMASSIFAPFFLFLFDLGSYFLPCFLIGGIFFVIQRLLSSRKIPYQEPPDPPKKDHRSLNSILDVVYDEEFIKKENPEFLKVTGYPPDWEERQKNCLMRDAYRCRICGETKRLHIHHIKPISFGGIHSLQNLITLCDTCHKAQEYYKHTELINENTKASRRYWVSSHTRSDGRKISGYFRRTGRRGLFWRNVRRVRSS